MAVRPAKTQISLGIRPVWSESSLSAWRNLGSLATYWASLGGRPGWSESSLGAQSFCWFCHVAAHIKTSVKPVSLIFYDCKMRLSGYCTIKNYLISFPSKNKPFKSHIRPTNQWFKTHLSVSIVKVLFHLRKMTRIRLFLLLARGSEDREAIPVKNTNRWFLKFTTGGTWMQSYAGQVFNQLGRLNQWSRTDTNKFHIPPSTWNKTRH